VTGSVHSQPGPKGTRAGHGPTTARILNVSIVVAARYHNPSILHPSFLESQGIVPATWEVAEDPFTTPPFSLVRYGNGITFRAEPSRLEVLHEAPEPELANSPVPELVARYVEKLPHVSYTAVGVNFTAIAPVDDPEQYLIAHFTKQERCSFSDLPLQAVSLTFRYSVEQGTLNVRCEPRVGDQESAGSGRGVIVSANYHTDCRGDQPLGEVVKAISLYRQRLVHFQEVALVRLFGISTTEAGK